MARDLGNWEGREGGRECIACLNASPQILHLWSSDVKKGLFDVYHRELSLLI